MEEKNMTLFDYYFSAFRIALLMNVSLAHAFNAYVKPYMPEEVPPMTSEQASLLMEFEEREGSK